MKKLFKLRHLLLLAIMLGVAFALCSCENIHSHTPGEWIVDLEPNCECGGVRHNECTGCGVTVKTESIPATGHTECTVTGYAATCTADGLTDGVVCSVCDEVITAQTVISALGHDEIAYEEKEPSCVEIGWDAYVECSRCDFSTYVEKPMIDISDVPVTITFYHTMSRALCDVLDEAIARFNELYPHITVIHTQVNGFNEIRDRVERMLSGDNYPNITYCYPEHVALYNLTKKVVALNGYIDSTITITHEDGTTEILGLTEAQINAFVDGFYAEGAVYDEAGTMYTLPMSKSAEVLYYNKTFFEEHNLTVPTTWDEMEKVCEQIREILINDDDPHNDNKTIFGYDSESNLFITMCKQYGSDYTSLSGDQYLFDNQTNHAFVKRLRGWYEKGYVTTQGLYGAYTSGLFTEEGIYMCIGSSASAQHHVPSAVSGVYPFEVAIAPIPQVDPENPAVISQGASLCVFDQKNKQEVVASWLFVKFLTTDPDFQASFSMHSGYMPVIEREVLVEAVPYYGQWLAGTAENLSKREIAIASAIAVGLDQDDAYFVPFAFEGSSKARNQVSALLQICLAIPTNDVDGMIKKMFEAAVNECKEES